MQWNMPFIPITPNFFETSIGISNNLHALEINSCFNFEICYFEMENLYFDFDFDFLNMKVHISILELLFQSKKLIFNYVNNYMNVIF